MGPIWEIKEKKVNWEKKFRQKLENGKKKIPQKFKERNNPTITLGE